MNLGLAAVGFIVILLGGLSGFYIVSIVGVFILIAAFLSPSRPKAPAPQPAPQTRAGTPSRAAPPRVGPQQPKPEMRAQPMPQQPSQPMPSQVSYQGYTSNMALFPATMFPSMSQPTLPVTPQPQQPTEMRESRDDLLEIGVILVLLKLLSG